MPVSGNEETGVKPVIRKSSDYVAGVPIKKRRFPIMRPPSPPSEEPTLFPKTEESSSFTAKNDSLQKEQSSPSQGSTLSYASITSSGFSDTTKYSESDYRRGRSDVTNVNVARGNDNLFRVKVEEASPTVHSGSLDDMQRKGKPVLADNPASQVTLGKSELILAPNEAHARNLGKEIMHSKSKVEMKCKEEIPAVAESTELSLGLKENLVPALTGQNSGGDGSQRSQDNFPISLNLSLSEEKNSSQCKGNGEDLNFDGADKRAWRANWDLNTPMDAWTDSVSDASESVDGINATGGAGDAKQLIGSTGMVGAGVNSEKQTIVDSQKRTNITVSPTLASQQCNSNDTLLLRLSSSCSQLNQCQNPSSACSKLDLDMDRVISSTNSPRLAGPVRTLNTDSNRAGKRAVVEQCTLGAVKSSNMSTQKLVDPRSIKSEPSIVDNQETINSIEGASVHPDKHVTQGLDNCSSDMTLPMTAEMSCLSGKPLCLTESTGKPSCSTELTMSRDLTKHTGSLNAKAPQEACQSKEHIAVTLGLDTKGNSMRTEDDNVDRNYKLKFMNDHPLDSRGSGEGSSSDEEKINISADMLDDSYGSDYESDGNHALDTTIDTEQDAKDDDYEDGEVRDSIEQTEVEELICNAREVEHVDNGDFDNNRTDFVAPVNNAHPTSFYIEAKDKTDQLAETSNSDYKESFDVVLNDKSDKGSDKDVCLQETLAVEKLTRGAGVKGSIKDVGTEPLDQSGNEDAQKCQDGEFSEQVTNESQGYDHGTELDDTTNGGQRSRIITLPRSSTVSPSKSRSISGLPLPSRVVGREILPDVTPEEDKIHPRGRGEPYVDNAHRFSRERYQDQSLRYARLGFRRGRGRMNSRGDWGSDRNFASEIYNNQTNYRVPRHKYAPDVSDAGLEYNTYNMGSDNAYVSTGRGGRQIQNDGPINHRIPSRRRSPVGTHAIHMARRNPRNISPTRCIGEDASNLIGMRHNEKFMRSFPDDNADPMFTRTQSSYEGVDGQFGRGNRNFSFVQRRGVPRVRSKSPIRSRTRSPGPWSSPRRRSPDGFGGPGELTHRRSPPVYRMERFRSPDGPCFPGEMVVRRNPPNDMRDMDSGRDHGPPRSVIPNRSPSGRVLLRNRRFDVMDPRERPNNDDYFGGPMHSGRLHELGADGNGDERRRFGERRGPVRSFRPPYNGADGETFHLNAKDGPRPLRFCPDDNTEFQERGNLRERDFDRRIKNRPGNAPRRMRGIEDQDGNYRHGGQAWHDEGGPGHRLVTLQFQVWLMILCGLGTGICPVSSLHLVLWWSWLYIISLKAILFELRHLNAYIEILLKFLSYVSALVLILGEAGQLPYKELS
ncbi:unnamed protein product [Prunus armeniaca]|uniref:Uncharacterized protein n=1 Tax=Prunus armeniaca TaxID=36596 RepID=A0A6J5U6A1_PRUAR|nr:unnamed protein product [Prunus armeniaca]